MSDGQPWWSTKTEFSAVVEMPRPAGYALDPVKTLLVIVDMQEFWRSPDHVRFLDIIDGNRRLREATQMSGVPTLFVQSMRHVESPEHTVFGVPLHLIEGSREAQIIDELKPRTDDIVVRKWSHDVWAWSELPGVLASRQIVAPEWSVIVTGFSVAGCARAAALGFVNRRFTTYVPVDCTAALTVESEALSYMQFSSPPYRDHVRITRSDMLRFRRPAS